MKLITVVREYIIYRKYTLKCLAVKHHNVCNLPSNSSEKICIYSIYDIWYI